MIIFLSLFQASLCQLGTGNSMNYTIEDLLPFDYDHNEFLNSTNDSKLSDLYKFAADICDSLTFTLSSSGYKNAAKTSLMKLKDDLPAGYGPKDWFNCAKEASTKVLSDKIMNEIFDETKIFCDKTHVYYDIGLEIRPRNNGGGISFIPAVNDSSTLIREITKAHNLFPKRRISPKKAYALAYAKLSKMNNPKDIDEEDDSEPFQEKELEIQDYLSWGPNYCTNSYSTFFLKKYGNWHTGNSKTQRDRVPIHNPGEDSDEDSHEDTTKELIYLKHLDKGGVCGAQMYTPQSRKLQLKETRVASQYMDVLPSITMNLLTNKKGSRNFSKMLDVVKVHLEELKTSSGFLQNSHTSVRIECLMKMKRNPSVGETYICFPDGFLDTKIGIFNSENLSEYYSRIVNEACNALLPIFPCSTDGEMGYKDLLEMSAHGKTACIYYSELLALEFGSMSLKGSIMKVLKKMFDKQGSYNILPNSKLRLKLSDRELKNSSLQFGLSPSLLSLENDLPTLSPRTVLSNSKMKMPLCITASPVTSVIQSSEIHVSYQQHRERVLQCIHKVLSPGEKCKYSGTISAH